MPRITRAFVFVGLIVGVAVLCLAGAAPAPKNTKPKQITNSIGMKLVLIPAGKFTMGSPAGEKKRAAGEGPQHEVEITKPFYLGVYEVTQEEYEKVSGKNPSWFSANGRERNKVAKLVTKRFPVENVTWFEARTFCTTLSEREEEKKAGRTYRLPTEAEWEYACRAGAKKYQIFHFGDALTSWEANLDGSNPYNSRGKGQLVGRPTTVGSYKPNAFGLYDMHGNVFEWCADWYGAGYYKSCKDQGTVKDPTGPPKGNDKIHRGGGWKYDGHYCRSACRGFYGPNNHYDYVGFRVVCIVGGEKN